MEPRNCPRVVPRPSGLDLRPAAKGQRVPLCRDFVRVSDGTRTRGRRDHNPEPVLSIDTAAVCGHGARACAVRVRSDSKTGPEGLPATAPISGPESTQERGILPPPEASGVFVRTPGPESGRQDLNLRPPDPQRERSRRTYESSRHRVPVASAREHWDRSRDPRAAAVGGLADSGRVIFAAAAVMVAVFFTFALSGPLPPKEMGVILGVSVLLDAMLVRLVLLPSLMRAFGRHAWRGYVRLPALRAPRR